MVIIMSVQEAWDYGVQMYHEGMDLNNIPEHFTAIEKENCIEAYETVSSQQSDLDCLDDDSSQIGQEDNYKELDFN